MLLRSAPLSRHPAVFRSRTGLRVPAFDTPVADRLPGDAASAQARWPRPTRRRASGAGQPFARPPRDQPLRTVVWLRRDPRHEVRDERFGGSDTTVRRLIARGRPLRDATGRETMRLPDPGRQRRRHRDARPVDPPALAVLGDPFAPRVQRPRDHDAAARRSRGKKPQHTGNVQVASNASTGEVVAVAESVPGPTAAIALVARSGRLARRPPGVGALGDRGAGGLDKPHVHGATPRRKPRGEERSAADRADNRAFARRRLPVAHTIRPRRCCQARTRTARQHRRHHAARTRAVAGLGNRRLRRVTAYRERLAACSPPLGGRGIADRTSIANVIY